MSDKITLTNLVNLQNETTAVNAINANNTVLTTALDNTVSRDGTSPNTMGAVLDMNSNQIINLPAPSTVNSPARLLDVTTNPTIVVPGTGTSGHVVPFLDGTNTWSGSNTFPTANVGLLTVTGPTLIESSITLPGNSVTNSNLALVSPNTVKGSVVGGNPSDLTKTQLTTLINPVTSVTSGVAPASGGGTSNFLRADASWSVPPTGTTVALETLTASSSANLQSSASWSGYSIIELVFMNIIPATTATTAYIQIHAASNYQTTGYLQGFGYVPNDTNIFEYAPTTWIPLSSFNHASSSAPGLSGTVRLYAPNTVTPTIVGGLTNYLITGTSLLTTWVASGVWNTSAVVDGFQFLFNSGNVASGSIKIYGIV
jgi:hypothetical protein